MCHTHVIQTISTVFWKCSTMENGAECVQIFSRGHLLLLHVAMAEPDSLLGSGARLTMPTRESSLQVFSTALEKNCQQQTAPGVWLKWILVSVVSYCWIVHTVQHAVCNGLTMRIMYSCLLVIGLPDLVPDLASFQLSLQRYPYVAQIPMSYLMCAREENCLSSSADNAPRTSIRRLLRFDSLTMNYGRADFLPNAHPHEYQWHSCHMHFHSFERFIDYDILDQLGNKIAEGHKASFCLEDSLCSGGRSPSYSCQIRQGISVNCGDRYGRHLDCQWIDITGVRPGEYVIRLRVNPTRESVESDYLNNEISCRITLHDRFYIVKSCSHSGECAVSDLSVLLWLLWLNVLSSYRSLTNTHWNKLTKPTRSTMNTCVCVCVCVCVCIILTWKRFLCC